MIRYVETAFMTPNMVLHRDVQNFWFNDRKIQVAISLVFRRSNVYVTSHELERSSTDNMQHDKEE